MPKPMRTIVELGIPVEDGGGGGMYAADAGELEPKSVLNQELPDDPLLTDPPDDLSDDLAGPYATG